MPLRTRTREEKKSCQVVKEVSYSPSDPSGDGLRIIGLYGAASCVQSPAFIIVTAACLMT